MTCHEHVHGRGASRCRAGVADTRLERRAALECRCLERRAALERRFGI